MSPCEDDSRHANKAVVQTSSPLLNLPTELFDQVIENVFTFPDPIEFSPIERTLSNLEISLGPSQYQRALDYQQNVRPVLRILRTCRAMFVSGAASYYGNNEFRFSSLFGGLVLARFFDLIGPRHTSQLRNITVAHPAIWENPTSHRHFFVRRLSPFGMADLPDYADTYNASLRMAALRDPLSTLQRISGLKHLTFLFHGTDYESLLPQSRLFELNTDRLLAHPVNAIFWNKTPGLQIQLLHLHHLCTNPIELTAIAAAISNPGANLQFNTPSRASAKAIQIVTQMHFQGWAFDDALVSHDSGVWPLKILSDGSVENTNICEDRKGWESRQLLEGAWWDSIGNDESVWYEGCVKCWHTDMEDKCDCDDGGTFLPNGCGWKGPSILIGNPGTPIIVDTSLADGKGGDVRWTRSAEVKDLEKCSWEVRQEVFGPLRY